MEEWQKFRPPTNPFIWGVGFTSPIAIWGITSKNGLVFYGSVVYLGILLLLSICLIVIKILKRRNDVYLEYAQRKIIQKRELIENEKNAIQLKECKLRLRAKEQLFNHYFHILKTSKPVDGDSSSRFVSEIESHALSVITKNLDLSVSDPSEEKPLKLVSSIN